jgi:hypothetical protein
MTPQLLLLFLSLATVKKTKTVKSMVENTKDFMNVVTTFGEQLLTIDAEKSEVSVTEIWQQVL